MLAMPPSEQHLQQEPQQAQHRQQPQQQLLPYMIQTTNNPLIPPPSAAHITSPPITANDPPPQPSSHRRSFFRLSLASLFNNSSAQRADREIPPPPPSASSTRSTTSLLPRHHDSNATSPESTSSTTTTTSSPINFICPDPRGHDATTLLTRRTELRHQRAWVRKRSNDGSCDDYFYDYDVEAGHRRRRCRGRRGGGAKGQDYRGPPFMTALCGPPTVRCKLLQFAVFGVALCGVLGTYLALALTPSTHLPMALHIVLIILMIILAIFLFHALLCALVLLHLQESSYSGGQHRTGRHRRHAKQHRRAHGPGIGRGMDHPDISVPAAGGAENRCVDVTRENDPDVLPLDDSVYSPNTPVRVHIKRDEEEDIGFEVSVKCPQRNTSPQITTAVEQTGHETQNAAEGRSGERDAAAVQEAESLEGIPDPPEYGHWRTSVKADPNLLHWRRVGNGHPAIFSPTSPTRGEAAGGNGGVARDHTLPLREESERPPSYVDIPPPGEPHPHLAAADDLSDEGTWPLRATEGMVAEVAEDDLVVRPRSRIDGGGGGGGGAVQGEEGEGDVQDVTRAILRGSMNGSLAGP